MPGLDRWLVRAAVASLLLAMGCETSSDTEEYTRPPATVEVVTLSPTTFEEVAKFTGALTASESVMVRPETTGVVETIDVQEGEHVKKGDLLFGLRSIEQRARLDEAVAVRDLAQRVYDRVESLKGNEVLSIEELDRAGSELAQATARLQIAEIELGRTQIRAPFDGVLGPRLVSPGDRVTGGSMSRRGDQTGLLQIDAIDELKLNFTLPEVAVNAVRIGIPLEISVAPFQGERFPGEIYFVAPSLDPLNRRLLIRALIPNAEHRLRAGLSATVYLPMGEQKGVLLAPESAIVHDVAGTFVWRQAEDGTAERVPVRLGARGRGMVAIASGLADGDVIVSAGTNKVSQGSPLETVEAETAEKAGS
ncbi:MAG: efflux RND transporter periplasmic adaptor subunit [Candidatus Binatia bacterium]|nr:efflux RND transporter periplasmic adaptor subunit [Candidatus Binatia bacterium]